MARRLAVLVIFIAVCPGCGLREIPIQSQIIGSVGMIKGRVENKSIQKGALIVLRYSENKDIISQEGVTQVNELGEYQFNVLPGTYYIAAFVDRNHDGLYQSDEQWNYCGNPTKISVAAGQIVLVEKITVSDTVPAQVIEPKIVNHLSPIFTNIGRVVGLDDPMFTRDKCILGMFQPVDFIAQVGGGLFFLQDYQQDKIPVVFIHGILGGPPDMKGIIESVDRRHFQPWVLYYPSGLRLNMVSEYLVEAIVDVQNRYGSGKFIVVGHSMGALVARSFVKKYSEQYPERLDKLIMGMTISGLMAGLPSAEYGLHSPVIVQCWRDVAPDSDFLKEINSWTWPKSVPYYLVFSYESDNGDGVVPLWSQLPLNLQQEATHIYGFKSGHRAILNDDTFLRQFNVILDSVRNEQHIGDSK